MALAGGLLLSLLFAIFFSGLEVAFLSANKLQIELLAKQRTPAGLVLAFFADRPTWFIGTTLIGSIASLLIFGFLTTELVLHFVPGLFASKALELLFIVLATLALTMVILYSVDYLSKSFFVINSGKVINALAIPFAVIAVILFPVAYLVITLAKFFSVNLMRLEYSMNNPVFGLTDVSQYLKSMQPEKSADQMIDLDTKIFTNALEFKSVRVRDCMIPRTEIVAVNLDGGISKLHESFIESGHSKIIVFRESIDDVIGYCHSSALFKNPAKIEDILTPIITVPEAMLAKDLLLRFINERKSLATVIDEFGGTSGIVSMEDVIEEIFGEIEDEHDQADLAEQKIDESTYLLSARLEVEYLNEKYGWSLPVGDYDTLSGLILSYTEDIPKIGDMIEIPPYQFTVHAKAENRINTVRLLIQQTTEGD